MSSTCCWKQARIVNCFRYFCVDVCRENKEFYSSTLHDSGFLFTFSWKRKMSKMFFYVLFFKMRLKNVNFPFVKLMLFRVWLLKEGWKVKVFAPSQWGCGSRIFLRFRLVWVRYLSRRGGTSYSGIYGKAPPKRDVFFQLALAVC